ncbi:MAG: hypothetical protein AAGA62_18120, partial [Bacteroidota bacterium]
GAWRAANLPAGLQLKDLSEGQHSLQVRAKKEGAFQWSNPVTYQLQIFQRWYKQSWIVWGLFSALLVFGLTVYFRKRRKYRRRIDALEAELTVLKRALANEE